jgi:hypothetical protein
MLTIGVILSDTTFRRHPGDVGSPDSYACPVIFHVARGITAAGMVRAIPDESLLDPNLQGALALQERGADVITTTCGFLAPLQDAIAERLRVPFVASSLLQIPEIYKLVRGRIGIITANAESFTPAHLDAAGISPTVPLAIRGLQDYTAFAEPLLRGIGEIDLVTVGDCVLQVAAQLMADFADIKAFVCECHNLPSSSAAIQQRTGKPVFDILTLVGTVLQATAVPIYS